MTISLVAVARYLSRLALVYWLGEMLFFISIFAPRVFKVLPRDMAGQLQASIFPAYYSAGIVAALVLAFSLCLRRLGGEVELDLTKSLALVGVACVIFLYSRFSITPELNALRPLIATDASAAERFNVLHKMSVRVNSAALFALLALLGFI
ncbi:MAG: DUF4149 domain-containing protein [Bdellovibrionales bacterium]|nr:DUF4149 domain-containing protein [Bdellovibrionales bacterium]